MLTISIVSHNQLSLMHSLLTNIIDQTSFDLILTINTDEKKDILSNYPKIELMS